MTRRVWIGTEDSSTAAPQVVQAFVQHVLRSVAVAKAAPHTVFQRVDTLPFTPFTGAEQKALAINAWRARADNHLIRLRRTLITELSRENTLVVLHIDADCPWGEPSALVEQFRTEVLNPIARHAAAEVPDFRLDRLLLLVPHRHIEAWTHQNTAVLRTFLVNAADLALVDAWTADRAELDHHENPKDRFPFKGGRNLKLATDDWPRSAVVAANGSFAHHVVGWAWNAEVRRLLDLS